MLVSTLLLGELMKTISIMTLLASMTACRTTTDDSSSTDEIEDLKAAVLDLQTQIAECAKAEETDSLSAKLEEETAARAEIDDAVAAIQADYVVASDLEGLATAVDISDLEAKITSNETAIAAYEVIINERFMSLIRSNYSFCCSCTALLCNL